MAVGIPGPTYMIRCSLKNSSVLRELGEGVSTMIFDKVSCNFAFGYWILYARQNKQNELYIQVGGI